MGALSRLSLGRFQQRDSLAAWVLSYPLYSSQNGESHNRFFSFLRDTLCPLPVASQIEGVEGTDVGSARERLNRLVTWLTGCHPGPCSGVVGGSHVSLKGQPVSQAMEEIALVADTDGNGPLACVRLI